MSQENAGLAPSIYRLGDHRRGGKRRASDAANDDGQLGLFAAGWVCHDLEELFTMRETSRLIAARMPDWVPIPDDVRRDGLSQQHVNPDIADGRLRGRSVRRRRSLAGGARGSFAVRSSPSACTASVTSRERRPAPIHHRWQPRRRSASVLARAPSRTRPRRPSDREGTARWPPPPPSPSRCSCRHPTAAEGPSKPPACGGGDVGGERRDGSAGSPGLPGG